MTSWNKPTLSVIPSDQGAAIVGQVADVAALVEYLHATGATLTAIPGRAGNDLRITLPAAPAVPARTRSWRPGTAVPQGKGQRPGWSRARVVLAVTGAVLALTAVAGLVWLVWVAVAWLIAHLAVIGAVLAVLAVVSIGGGGACVTTVRVTHHH